MDPGCGNKGMQTGQEFLPEGNQANIAGRYPKISDLPLSGK